MKQTTNNSKRVANAVEFVTLAEYKAFEEKMWCKDYSQRNWKTINERDARQAELNEMYKHLMPEVGQGCTEILYSDYLAETIVEVITPNKVATRRNKVKCLDYYASDYEILDELEGGERIFTRRRSGRWVAEGQPDKSGSVFLRIDYRDHRIDPSF